MSGACWGPRVRGERMQGSTTEGGASRRRGWGLRATKGLGGVPVFAWVAAHGSYVLGACSHYISSRPWHW